MRFRPSFSLLGLLIVFSSALASIFLPFFGHVRGVAYQSSCQSNLHQLGIAYLQYVEDNDHRTLPVSIGEQGWGDLLHPYMLSWDYFQCPAGRLPQNPRRTDYFYNARLAGLSEARISSQVIVLGDGYDNSGLNAHLSELPFDWKDDEESGAFRHIWYPNYVFTDGHVKGVRFRNISNISITDGALYTFNPALTNPKARK